MSQPGIDPVKVTRPIQLLAAWLAGLILTNGSFLGAALEIKEPHWAAGCLIIAAILNIPVFLGCLFLLQTKFRPEMQEDLYYARYLERRVSIQTGREELVDIGFSTLEGSRAVTRSAPRLGPIPTFADASRSENQTTGNVRVNDLLPDYQKIAQDLIQNQIKIAGTFGSTSQIPEVPRPFLLAVGYDFPITTFQIIFKTLLKYNLEGICLASQQIAQREIYIGSYGYNRPNFRYLTISNELAERLLSPGLNFPELALILKDTGVTT